MASFAALGGDEMARRILAARRRVIAVMAVFARSRDLRVIERNACPAGGHMAAVAGIRRAEMARHIFACGRKVVAIVAADTGAKHLGMVEVDCRPVGGDVTTRAVIG